MRVAEGVAGSEFDVNEARGRCHDLAVFVDSILMERQQKRKQLQRDIDKMSECQVDRVLEFLKPDLEARDDHSWLADDVYLDLEFLAPGRQQELLAFVMGVNA